MIYIILLYFIQPEPVIFKVNSMVDGVIDIRVNIPPDVYVMNSHVLTMLATETDGCIMLKKTEVLLENLCSRNLPLPELKYYQNSLLQIRLDTKKYCKK